MTSDKSPKPATADLDSSNDAGAAPETPMPFTVDEDFLAAAHERVAEDAPEIASLSPQVRPMPPNIVLIYTTTTPLHDGLTLTRITRAVIDAEGQIVKLSTSRG
jgi:hypothetical protein